MASNIDPTKPESGSAKTADVRANFDAAKSEIEALQEAVGGKQASSALLAAIAALDSSNGVLVQTAAGAAAKRKIGVASSNDIPDRAAADTRYAALSGASFGGQVASTIGIVAAFYTPWSAIGSATAGAANGAGYLGSNLHWDGSNWVATVSHASIGARGVVFNYPSFGDFRYADAPGPTAAGAVVTPTFHTIWHSGNLSVDAAANGGTVAKRDANGAIAATDLSARTVSAGGQALVSLGSNSDSLDAYFQMNGSANSTLAGSRGLSVVVNTGGFGLFTGRLSPQKVFLMDPTTKVIDFAQPPTVAGAALLKSGGVVAADIYTAVKAIMAQGANVTLSADDAAKTLTVASSAGSTGTGGYTSVTQTANATLVKNQSFIANSATTLTFTLPTTAAAGDRFEVVGAGTGGWRIAQNAGQKINFNGKTTTPGTGDGIQSADYRDCMELVCTAANTTFTVVDSQGTPQVTGEWGYTLTLQLGGALSPAVSRRSVFAFGLNTGSHRYLSAQMATDKDTGCVVQNSSYGWSIGGSTVNWSGATNAIDRFAFSSETSSVASTTSSDTWIAGSGMNTTLGKGYRWGRQDSNLSQYSPDVVRFTYATEACVSILSNPTVTGYRNQFHEPVANAGTKSYIFGSENAEAVIDRLDASTETSTNTVTSMDQGNRYATAGNSATKGYRVGGISAGGATVGTRGSLPFSSETYTTISGNLTKTRFWACGFNNATKMVIAGGNNGSGYDATYEDFIFATETSVNQTALTSGTIADYIPSCVQSGGYL